MAFRLLSRAVRVHFPPGRPRLCLQGKAASNNSTCKASPFPTLPIPPLPPLPTSTTTHQAYEDNLQLFSDVLEQRKKVWSNNEAISSRDRSGRKLTVRERLALLADPGSEVLEIGTLAGLNMPYGDVYHGNNIVCVARVCGEVCVISANNWTFKGGTAYPISVKKQLRAQEIALANRLPCIYFVDSGGAFLPLQVCNGVEMCCIRSIWLYVYTLGRTVLPSMHKACRPNIPSVIE